MLSKLVFLKILWMLNRLCIRLATRLYTVKVFLFFQCKTLEELGFDSLMVISSKDRHMELGSAKGRSFIEAYPDYFEEFVHYCKGERNLMTKLTK